MIGLKAMTAEKEPLHSIIGRVRRAMPRNADVMAICDYAEKWAMRVDPHDVTNERAPRIERLSRPVKFSRKAK